MLPLLQRAYPAAGALSRSQEASSAFATMATLLPLYAETLSRGELSHEWKGKAMPDVHLAQQQFVRYPFQAESIESLHGWARAHDAKASQSQWVRLTCCAGVRCGAWGRGAQAVCVYRYPASDETVSRARHVPRMHLPRAARTQRQSARGRAHMMV